MAQWTLTDFLRDLRSRIDEPVADYFSDEELVRWINEGLSDLSLELRIEELSVIPLSTSATFIDLPTDLVSIRSVYLDNAPIKLVNVDERTSTSSGCYLWGKKLYFTQPVTGTVELFYNRDPLALANPDDVTDIPSRYQHLPILYAFARCKEKDEDQAIANSIMEQYQSFKYEMINELRQRQQSDGVSFVEPYLGGGDSLGF